MKYLEKESVDDKILSIVNEKEQILRKNENNRSIENSKKKDPDKTNELEEVLLNYMGENDVKTLKTGFPDNWKFLSEKLAYPYEFFYSIEDYQKPVNKLKKEDFFSNLSNKCPDDKEIKQTMNPIKRWRKIIKNVEELTELYCKSDVLLLACVFEKFIRVSVNEFGNNLLYCVNLQGYTWQCGLKYTGKKLTNTSR